MEEAVSWAEVLAEEAVSLTWSLAEEAVCLTWSLDWGVSTDKGFFGWGKGGGGEMKEERGKGVEGAEGDGD